MNIHDLKKNEIRYILYLARTSHENKKVLYNSEDHKVVMDYIETFDDFKKLGGWGEFAKRWDVEKNEENHWIVLKRKVSEQKEWEAVVLYRSEIFPALEGGEYKKLINK